MGQETIPCPHHWMIERAAGPTSKGVCRLCGEERDFDNSLEAPSWVAEVKRRRDTKAANLK